MSKEDLMVCIGLVVFTGVFILGTLGIKCLIEAKRCEDRFASFEHKYGIFSGCLIKVNDQWVPDESYYIKEDRAK